MTNRHPEDPNRRRVEGWGWRLRVFGWRSGGLCPRLQGVRLADGDTQLPGQVGVANSFFPFFGGFCSLERFFVPFRDTQFFLFFLFPLNSTNPRRLPILFSPGNPLARAS